MILKSCLLFSVVVCIATVYAQQPGPDYGASPNPHIRLFANVLRESVWPEPRIFICWENLTKAYETPAGLVRSAVSSTWEMESRVRFIGWQPCAAENAGVRIKIDDSGPHTKALGRRLDRRRDGMVLNFEFKNWSQSCASMRDYCIKGLAVHEFGHALGFAHEQNRFDAPGECQQLKQGTRGDLLLTPYDPRSVMNYCNPKYNNDGMLSSLDIAAVREIYGGPSDKPRLQ